MVDGEFGLHYFYHNILLSSDGMADSKIYEESISTQSKKRTDHLQCLDDISKFIHYNRGKKKYIYICSHILVLIRDEIFEYCKTIYFVFFCSC